MRRDILVHSLVYWLRNNCPHSPDTMFQFPIQTNLFNVSFMKVHISFQKFSTVYNFRLRVYLRQTDTSKFSFLFGPMAKKFKMQFSPYPCSFQYGGHTTHNSLHTQNTVTPNSSLIPLTLDYLRSPPLGLVSYESLPIQELTTSLCNLLAHVHPEDGGDTILRNVGSYKSHTVSSPRRW
jgi:hypothetical protein